MANVAFDINHPGISVYQALTSKDLSEEDKAKIIAEAIDSISKEFPNLRYVATQEDLKNTELRLIKEIEQVRLEIKELDGKLSKEIKELDGRLTKEIKELDGRLTKEIKELDGKISKEIKELDGKLTKEIKELEVKLKDTKFTMLKWQFIFWIGQMSAILGMGYMLLKAMSLNGG